MTNLNTVEILFCKVAVHLVKFAFKDLKTTEKTPIKIKATLPICSTLKHKRKGSTQENKCRSWK